MGAAQIHVEGLAGGVVKNDDGIGHSPSGDLYGDRDLGQ
jgi:hypothetical protein